MQQLQLLEPGGCVVGEVGSWSLRVVDVTVVGGCVGSWNLCGFSRCSSCWWLCS